MHRKTSRRQFLVGASVFTAGTIGFPFVSRAQNKGDQVRMAVIGSAGQGGVGFGAAMGQQLVAMVDVDLRQRAAENLAAGKEKFPGVKVYTDYRRMFDDHLGLDAVWVATPDHSHFPAAVRALDAGLAVYCEKPLTHSIREAKVLRDMAGAKRAVTQMGNQGHSSESIRLIVEYLQSGLLGDVTTLHCVSNRSFSASTRPPTGPVPEGLDWEAWLGPAPFREYHDGLHPFAWRGYLDFGTASLGDMGCHTIDGAVWGLRLDEADTVEVVAEAGGTTAEGYTPEARIVYTFPARGNLPPVTMTWWNGGGGKNLPPRPPMLEEGREQLQEGTYYYGTKAALMSGSHCQGVRIFPETAMKEAGKPPQVVPRVPGHTEDFLRAVKDPTAPAPSSNFAYSTRLTEIVLLGTVALRAGQGTRIVYDMKAGKVITNNGALNTLLWRAPRKGWEFGYPV